MVILLLVAGVFFLKWLKSIFKAVALTMLLALVLFVVGGILLYLDVRALRSDSIIFLFEHDGMITDGFSTDFSLKNITLAQESLIDEANSQGFTSLSYERVILFKDLPENESSIETITQAFGHDKLFLLKGIQEGSIVVHPKSALVRAVLMLPGGKT